VTWFICHGPTCPRPAIDQQNAQDAREAHALRLAAQEAAELARERMSAEAAQGAEARAEALAALKSTMASAHPDRGGDAAAFIAALRAYRAARRG
jgi:hypothetical protein